VKTLRLLITFVPPQRGTQAIALADPAVKKVWLIEGAQSFGQAFARGFVRGPRPRGSAAGARPTSPPASTA
jgi:hypothetical protein